MFTHYLKQFQIRKLIKLDPLKLNIGCGEVKLKGWVNIDIDPKYKPDIILDIRRRLPFATNSIGFIYNEHLFEHFTYEEGERVLREFYRCLKTDGVLRMAMPDLDYNIQKYNTDWKSLDWVSWPGNEFITTRGRMINASFRNWGHKYIYNEEDFKNQLISAGFKKIIRCNWNESNYPELANLETRKNSKLIMETIK